MSLAPQVQTGPDYGSGCARTGNILPNNRPPFRPRGGGAVFYHFPLPSRQRQSGASKGELPRVDLSCGSTSNRKITTYNHFQNRKTRTYINFPKPKISTYNPQEPSGPPKYRFFSLMFSMCFAILLLCFTPVLYHFLHVLLYFVQHLPTQPNRYKLPKILPIIPKILPNR